MHPLTPLLRGGLFLLVVIGAIVANFRDHLIALLLPWMAPPSSDNEGADPSDVVDFVVRHNLVALAAAAVVAILIVILGAFSLSWRFRTFRITGDDVEVRSGVIFRTHRKAPLDRVQGVNLTRPMIARLLGAAKLDVIGAGADSNVTLEYLSTANAEAVRADILKLASGRHLVRSPDLDVDADANAAAPRRLAATTEMLATGLTGLIAGVDTDEAEPASVVHIPSGRLVVAHLLSGGSVALLAIIAVVTVGLILGAPWALFALIPSIIGLVAFWFRRISRTLRYRISPTAAGVRMTFGLFTTITETLPPGRVHAVEVRQPLLWRPFGWWSIQVNRLSGGSSSSSDAQQLAEILPVGTRVDAQRVLALLLPAVPETAWEGLFVHGIDGPVGSDPFVTSPRRAWWLNPLSFRRNGLLLTPALLLFRRGFVWRTLAMVPLARMQSVTVTQGALARPLRIASIAADTIAGPVRARVGSLDRDAVLSIWNATSAQAVIATSGDRSHRWDELEVPVMESMPEPVPAEPAMTMHEEN